MTAPRPMPDDALLRLPEAAARLGVCERTVRRLAAADAGFPTLLRIGPRSRRIRASDLHDWIARHK